MKVLLVTLYFPPAGGGGVQRPLKFATHLPALGIETHVLAPDNPKWIHMDDELLPPTQAWVHRVRYLGTQGAQAVGGAARQARRRARAHPGAAAAAPARRSGRGRDLERDGDPRGAAHRASGEDRRRDHDVAAGLRASRRRGGEASARRALDRRPARLAARAPGPALGHRSGAHEGAAPCASSAGLVARRADAIVTAFDSIGEEMRALSPAGRIVTIPNGSDFDDFDGMAYTPGERFRITHTGAFFGQRDPKPFLRALAESGLEDVVVRFVGGFRAADREFAESLGLADRVEVIPFVPRRRSLELQRDSEALLLIAAEAGGRGTGVIPGKVFEYVAAERPILAAVPPGGAAAKLIDEIGAGIVAPVDDVEALRARARRAARAAGSAASSRSSSRPTCASASRAARASPSSPSSCTSSQ